MAYSKHTWTDDEVITKEKLNNIETGIESINTTNATTEIKGLMKMVSATSEISTSNVDSPISGTQSDTQLEAMRNLLNETKGKVNELLTKLKNAGIMES